MEQLSYKLALASIMQAKTNFKCKIFQEVYTAL